MINTQGFLKASRVCRHDMIFFLIIPQKVKVENLFNARLCFEDL